MRLTLPIPPTIYKLWVQRRGGGKAKSKKYNEWIDECDALLLGREPKKFVFERKGLIIKMTFYTKWINKNGTVKKADVDNRVKAVLDYLPRYIEDFDDSYVWESHEYKQNSGRDEVEIKISETKYLITKK